VDRVRARAPWKFTYAPGEACSRLRTTGLTRSRLQSHTDNGFFKLVEALL